MLRNFAYAKRFRAQRLGARPPYFARVCIGTDWSQADLALRTEEARPSIIDCRILAGLFVRVQLPEVPRDVRGVLGFLLDAERYAWVCELRVAGCAPFEIDALAFDARAGSAHRIAWPPWWSDERQETYRLKWDRWTLAFASALDARRGLPRSLG